MVGDGEFGILQGYSGGAVTSDVDLNGVAAIVYDADGNTKGSALVDDTWVLAVGGTPRLTLTTSLATLAVPLTASSSATVAAGIEKTGSGTCTGADSVLADNNGYVGCQKLTDVAPQGMLIRAQPAYAAGTQTAAITTITGGQDETLTAIDGADPSVSCAGENDTVTVTVIDSNGASTATILTEDQTIDAATDWTASASVANTCASLAAAVNALAGVGATCTSPNVLFTIDTNTATVALAESTAGCTTVAMGTRGAVVIAPGFGGTVTLGGAGGGVTLGTATTASSTLTVSSTLTASATFVSTRTTDIGWSITAAGNQACNTTCTNACVHGWDTAAGEVSVLCTDATADKCLCAGAS